MEFNGVCPWCGGSRLYWNSDKNVYICFSGGCSRKGKGKPPVETWLSAHTKVEFAVEEVKLPDGSRPLFSGTPSSLCDKRIARYLGKHHIAMGDARRYGLLQTDSTLVIPFYNQEGELVYFQERSVFGPKLFKNAQVPKEDTMFFTDEDAGEVVLVESAIGAIRVRSSFGPAGAFLGKPIWAQIERLRNSRRSIRKVRILMDSDAHSDAVKIFGWLKGYIERVSIHLLPWGDPCDVPDKLLRKVLNE